ncbi:MAG: hypothetical protein Q9191_002411, partial [Dirinaria sp. TL-2023a]
MLDEEDHKALVADSIILPKVAGGKRKVSAALLSSPPSSGASSTTSSSASSAFVRYHPATVWGAKFDLPTDINSAAAVEFCGFNASTAQSIYTRWHGRPDKENNPDELIDYMKADCLGAGHYNQMPPAEALARMGLSEHVQRAILDEAHTQVRLTDTTTYWARDTLEVNWETLERLMQNLKAAATRSRASKKAEPAAAPGTAQSAAT